MRAVLAPAPGGPEALVVTEIAAPVPRVGEILVQVTASAVNRADLFQRQGLYPPPPGITPVLGLECSGTVVATGPGVTRWQVGDEVCALLAGGGYAELVVVPEGQCLPVPAGLSTVESAALPEVACTVWSNVVTAAGLRAGETLLVHGGAGGVGSFAIGLGKALGARVVATVGSAAKAEFVAGLGADVVVDYQRQDFVAEVAALGGADVILDNMGASYLMRNIAALAPDGRLVVIGLQGGVTAELDLGALMARRGHVVSTSLRGRSVADKASVCAAVEAHVWPLVASGAVRPVVHSTYPLDQAADAHRAMEASEQLGKILLTVA